LAGLVVVELKAVNGKLDVQAGELETAFHSTLRAGFQFAIQQSFQGLGDTKIAARRFRQRRFQLLAHGGQVELLQFLLQGVHR
jgi:hypothetical protein